MNSKERRRRRRVDPLTLDFALLFLATAAASGVFTYWLVFGITS